MLGRTKRLFINVTILTASSLLIRLIAFVFQVWLASQVGSEGIGLFQLVMSVSAFASTLAISGVSYAAVRLVSEEIGLGRPGGVGRAVRHCMVYALLFGLLSSALLLACSDRLALQALGDTRAAVPMRLLAITLPLISILTVMQGYFTAVGRVYKTAAVHVAEQIARVIIIILIVRRMPSDSIETSCTLIVAGGAASEILSFILMLVLYITDRMKHRVRGHNKVSLTRRMIRSAMPIAVISYTKTALSMIQNLLIPGGLIAAGLTKEAALSGYGIIQGMVMPIIYFPSCVLFSTAELVVPDMTEAQVRGDMGYISETVASLLGKCHVFSVCIAGIAYVYAEQLSVALYHSLEAVIFIKVFALLLPVLYLNMMIDGLLRGLGQQTYCMIYSIAAAVLSTVLIKISLPLYALTAYVLVFAATESLVFILCLFRLNKLTALRISAGQIIMPIICAAGSFNWAEIIIRHVKIHTTYALVLSIALGCALYAALIIVTRCDKKSVAIARQL